jgi:hypothetical protein
VDVQGDIKEDKLCFLLIVLVPLVVLVLLGVVTHFLVAPFAPALVGVVLHPPPGLLTCRGLFDQPLRHQQSTAELARVLGPPSWFREPVSKVLSADKRYRPICSGFRLPTCSGASR